MINSASFEEEAPEYQKLLLVIPYSLHRIQSESFDYDINTWAILSVALDWGKKFH